MSFDITAIINGHAEGRLSVASLRSFWEAIDHAVANGLSVQPLLVLDNPEPATEETFRALARDPRRIMMTYFADQGAARNAAIEKAEGRYTAFLDADDLWTPDWLTVSFDFLKDRPDNVIAHPQYNYFFESQATIFTHIDQEDPEFRLDLLRVGNYWDALCLCPTQIYRDHPFYPRQIKQGWAYEDWYWNCETVAAGVLHKVVPDTVLFKRRQRISQTMRAAGNKSRIKINPLSPYDSPLYDDQKEATQ